MQIDFAKKQQAIAHINELSNKHKVFYNLLLHCHEDFLELANEMGIKVSKLYPDEEKEPALPEHFNFGSL